LKTPDGHNTTPGQLVIACCCSRSKLTQSRTTPDSQWGQVFFFLNKQLPVKQSPVMNKRMAIINFSVSKLEIL